MSDNNKPVEYVTPRGTLYYPSLHEPDYGTDDYPVPEGQFRTAIRFRRDDSEAWDTFISKLEMEHAKAVDNGQQKFDELKFSERKRIGEIDVVPLLRELYNEETEEPTGEYELRLKMPFRVEVKRGPKAGKIYKFKPDVFDAHRRLMSPVPELSTGTVARVKFDCFPYFIEGTALTGLKLRLKAVQVIDAVIRGNGDASGFEDEEDGFSFDPELHAPPTAPDEKEDTDTDDARKDPKRSAEDAGDF